ncbi:ATP synthase subunit I [Bradymonas sediminis]|uniref:ATP synthase subunit I n=1 Tax=Bradymonas sediminis TaxID=1548548 RepID=A0A2Z4FJW1_9DELT|nr:ATP synthase subunit I [Bradymonas sediminis]AWV89267.1 ATP synthase subunit I [Bradymonas sediminis]TDP73438.1 F1F0 ATPase subunit 2 [Bradymonas sediminis]
MNDAFIWFLAGLGGVALGGLFFGSLWWTVQKVTTSARPALWAVGSFVLRMVVTVGGFYLVGGGQWQRIVACLAGFLLARAVITRVTELHAPLTPEPTHAP